MVTELDSKTLLKLIERRHPEYEEQKPHWEFLEDTYEGGRGWFKENIFRYVKEGDAEYKARVERAYRFNHSKEVVDLVGKYIFKAQILRNEKDAPEVITNFWKKTSKNGMVPIAKFIREVEKKSSIFGRIWIVVDNTRAFSDDPREYAYVILPEDALDMSYDEDGSLNWILIRETYRDDSDPFEASGDVLGQYRLWTKDAWMLIRTSKAANGEKTAYVADEGVHGLGVVPVFAHDHNEAVGEPYCSPSLIADIAYLDRACANYLSNLDAIIQDQSFSQLAMPAQGLMPGDDDYNSVLKVGVNRVFLYDAESGGQPFYLSPDPKQAEIIITAIGKIINEIYHTVGMAGERTKQDNSIGIDNSSGVAKAIDFERVNALLMTKASGLKQAEIKMMELVLRWNGIDDQEAIDSTMELITYPTSFDVRGIAEEFLIASDLVMVEAPIGMKKQQLRIMIPKLFPQIDKASREKLLKEVDDMEEISMLPSPQQQVDPANFTPKGNKQGQVTDKTPK